MAKSLTTSELNLLIKENVKNLEDGRGYCSIFGFFDLHLSFVDGTYLRMIDCSDGDSSITIYNSVEFPRNHKKYMSCHYALMKAAEKKKFVEYLKSKSYEECVTDTGFHFIQEIGADNTSNKSLADGDEMMIVSRTPIKLF